MTLVSDIIVSAYRESNLVPINGSVTEAESNEALQLLNSIVQSAVGFEIGDGLWDLRLGAPYDQSSLISSWVPDNIRLILNLTGDTEVTLDPEPFEGQRLAIVDVAGNLNTNNLTIDPNGRLIENATTLVLSTASMIKQWMYRADIGNWEAIDTLASTDSMPFAADCDDFFITALAVRLNSRNNKETSPETIKSHARAKSYVNSKYHKPRQIQSDLDARVFSGNNRRYHSIYDFNTGNPWPYL